MGTNRFSSCSIARILGDAAGVMACKVVIVGTTWVSQDMRKRRWDAVAPWFFCPNLARKTTLAVSRQRPQSGTGHPL